MSPVAVIARLSRLRRIIDSELEATFAEHRLNGSDFAALVTLRRLDEPAGVSQRRLMQELRLTSGTVSVRVERLAERGLVTRSPDPADRRNTLVALTEAGGALFERVVPAHLATERRLLSALTAGQASDLAGLLRQLLLAFEGSVSGDEFPRLGLALTPAHVTIETRRAAGLPEVAGLLVRGVEPGSRAERAGLRIGDVLVRAGDRELRSVSSLYAALNDAGQAGSLVVGAVRGPQTRVDIEVSLAPDPSDHLFPPPVQPPGAEATHAV
jgi:DNA-binding MarR family transcriptional regulator